MLARVDLRGFRRPARARSRARPARATTSRPRSPAIIADVRARRRRRASASCTARFDGCGVDDLRGRRRPSRRPRSSASIPSCAPRSSSPATRSSRGTRRSASDEARPRALGRATCASSSSRSTAPAATCPAAARRYPSSVLMTAIPARVAGVRRGRALRRRPAPTARVHDAILAAAALAGVDEVYRVGGAQAIAALAYGTEIDPRRST